MKQITAFLLAFLFLLSLCACGGTKVDAPATPSATIPVKETPAPVESPAVLPDTGKKAPSGTLITEDITSALTEKNPHAAITSVEVLKSQTQDTSYYVTLQLTAQSKYADFQYEADLYYTKYDQGWMLDRVDWVSVSYELARYPGTEEMVAYAEDYLKNHEIYSDPTEWKHAEYMLPMQNAGVGLEPEEDAVIRLSWLAKKTWKYTEDLYRITSLWRYICESDSWVLAPDTDSIQGYYLYDEYISTSFLDIDYSGNVIAYSFDGGILSGKPIGNLVISDFSWEDLYVYIPEYMDEPRYLTRIYENDLKRSYSNVFMDETGKYRLELDIEKDSVRIIYGPTGQYGTLDWSQSVGGDIIGYRSLRKAEPQSEAGSTVQDDTQSKLAKVYCSQIYSWYETGYTKTYDYSIGQMRLIGKNGVTVIGAFDTDASGRITYEEVGYAICDSSGNLFEYYPVYKTYHNNGMIESEIFDYADCVYNDYGLVEKENYISYIYEYLSYDQNGHPTSALATPTVNGECPHNSFPVTLKYSIDGRLLSAIYASETTTTHCYLYDSLGNLVEQRSTYPEYTQVTTYVYE